MVTELERKANRLSQLKFCKPKMFWRFASNCSAPRFD